MSRPARNGALSTAALTLAGVGLIAIESTPSLTEQTFASALDVGPHSGLTSQEFVPPPPEPLRLYLKASDQVPPAPLLRDNASNFSLKVNWELFVQPSQCSLCFSSRQSCRTRWCGIALRESFAQSLNPSTGVGFAAEEQVQQDYCKQTVNARKLCSKGVLII